MKPKWVRTKANARVFVRHEKGCPAYEDNRCRCKPSFRGEVWNPDTKRPAKSCVYYHSGEAEGWVADYARGIDSPAPAHVSGVMVADFFVTFFAAARAGTALRKGGKRYASRTVDIYERDVRHHVASHVAGRSVEGMDAQAWQLVVEAIMTTGARGRDGEPNGQPLAASSVSGIMAAVRAAYRWGAAPSRRIVSSNPIRDVEIPSGEKPKRKRVAAPEMIPVLLDALRGRRSKHGDAPNPAVRIAWAIMFYAGLRVSEAAALDWPDIELGRGGGWIIVGQSKTEAGEGRRVPIAAPLARILHDWRAENDGARIGPVLRGARSFRLSASTIDNAATRWAGAGLPDYSPHEARHTFASSVIANRDVSLADLQEWLGHASLQTTARYVQTLPGWRQESAGARLSDAFGA